MQKTRSIPSPLGDTVRLQNIDLKTESKIKSLKVKTMFLIDCKKYNISNSVATKAKTKNDSLQSIRGPFGYLFESFWKPFFTGFFEGLSSSVAVPLRVCVCVCVLACACSCSCCACLLTLLCPRRRAGRRTDDIYSIQSIHLSMYLSIHL